MFPNMCSCACPVLTVISGHVNYKINHLRAILWSSYCCYIHTSLQIIIIVYCINRSHKAILTTYRNSYKSSAKFSFVFVQRRSFICRTNAPAKVKVEMPVNLNEITLIRIPVNEEF